MGLFQVDSLLKFREYTMAVEHILVANVRLFPESEKEMREK